MNSALKSPLNIKERARFKFCKERIQLGLKTVWETGASLAEIRDDKLYREDFETFEDFCRETYQMERAQAYRLIEAREVKDSLGKLGNQITNESQARALAVFPIEERPKIIKELTKNGEPVTAEKIASFQCPPNRNVSPIGDKSKKETEEVLTDETGLTVPKELIPLWERASEVSDVMAQIQRVKRTLTEAQKSDDLLWSRLNFDNVKNELTAAWFAIQDLLPYAVCPTCQGRMPKNCLHCKRRGFIGKYTWDHTVTIEIKAIRTKVVATQK